MGWEDVGRFCASLKVGELLVDCMIIIKDEIGFFARFDDLRVG